MKQQVRTRFMRQPVRVLMHNRFSFLWLSLVPLALKPGTGSSCQAQPDKDPEPDPAFSILSTGQPICHGTLRFTSAAASGGSVKNSRPLSYTRTTELPGPLNFVGFLSHIRHIVLSDDNALPFRVTLLQTGFDQCRPLVGQKLDIVKNRACQSS